MKLSRDSFREVVRNALVEADLFDKVVEIDIFSKQVMASQDPKIELAKMVRIVRMLRMPTTRRRVASRAASAR